MDKSKKILGILGGMGAKAGAAFYDRLVDLTPANKDQDHIEVILYANPAVPDRTEGILGIGADPYPVLLESLKRVVKCGAEVIAIPCVSAHYYVPRLREETSSTVLSAVELTVEVIREEYGGRGKIGILGTTGTIRSGLFQDALEEAGLEPVVPPPDIQESLVMEAIYGAEGLKAGNLEDGRRRAFLAAERLAEMGAEGIIIGCSELPLVLREADFRVRLFDSMGILIEKAIEICMG